VTPFGKRLRELRRERGISAKEMAAGLGVSPAYLSALEHGRRGKPNKRFVHRICQYFGIIWDEAEALQAVAALSHAGGGGDRRPQPRGDRACQPPGPADLRP
jgi:transcriptional regulator with XRE-family HTH domain